jgi:hypothetical protein
MEWTHEHIVANSENILQSWDALIPSSGSYTEFTPETGTSISIPITEGAYISKAQATPLRSTTYQWNDERAFLVVFKGALLLQYGGTEENMSIHVGQTSVSINALTISGYSLYADIPEGVDSNEWLVLGGVYGQQYYIGNLGKTIHILSVYNLYPIAASLRTIRGSLTSVTTDNIFYLAIRKDWSFTDLYEKIESIIELTVPTHTLQSHYYLNMGPFRIPHGPWTVKDINLDWIKNENGILVGSAPAVKTYVLKLTVQSDLGEMIFTSYLEVLSVVIEYVDQAKFQLNKYTQVVPRIVGAEVKQYDRAITPPLPDGLQMTAGGIIRGTLTTAYNAKHTITFTKWGQGWVREVVIVNV